MTKIAIPPYPVSLTVQSWDKAKGLIARISGVKTGVTELLQAAQKQFKDAPWSEATNDEVVAEISRGGLQPLQEWHKDYAARLHPKFRALQTTYANLSSTLAEKAQAFEKDEKLAKFAPVLKKMSEDANKFTYAVSWPTVSDGVNKAVLNRTQQLQERKKKAGEYVSQMEGALDKVIKKLDEFDKKPPTPAQYEKLFSAYHRLPGTFIGVVGKDYPHVGVMFKDYMSYASKHFTKEPDEKTDMKKQVAKDREQFETAKKLVKQIVL